MKIFGRDISKDFLFFIGAAACIAFAQGIVNSTFNNFLSERFTLTSIQRTLLEIPREVPGVIVIFVSALFFFFCFGGLNSDLPFFTGVLGLSVALNGVDVVVQAARPAPGMEFNTEYIKA